MVGEGWLRLDAARSGVDGEGFVHTGNVVQQPFPEPALQAHDHQSGCSLPRIDTLQLPEPANELLMRLYVTGARGRLCLLHEVLFMGEMLVGVIIEELKETPDHLGNRVRFHRNQQIVYPANEFFVLIILPFQAGGQSGRPVNTHVLITRCRCRNKRANFTPIIPARVGLELFLRSSLKEYEIQIPEVVAQLAVPSETNEHK